MNYKTAGHFDFSCTVTNLSNSELMSLTEQFITTVLES